MKKLLIATMISLFAVGITTSAYALPANETLTTGVTAKIVEIFDLSFGAPGVVDGPGEKARSSTSITFYDVDGSATWYYNKLATLGVFPALPNPIDGKSDVALVCKSNIAYTLLISKTADTLDGKIGYEVGGAFDGGATTTTATDGTVNYPTGFAGSTGTGKDGWGELPTSTTLVYTSGTDIYAIYGAVIPISYALVPTGLATDTYNTTITYTMVPTP